MKLNDIKKMNTQIKNKNPKITQGMDEVTVYEWKKEVYFKHTHTHTLLIWNACWNIKANAPWNNYCVLQSG